MNFRSQASAPPYNVLVEVEAVFEIDVREVPKKY